MKILKTVFAAILVCIFSIPLYAQHTEMESKGNAAIRRGDYKEAVSQLSAHKAYLMTEGYSENSKEVLQISKKIVKASSCEEAMTKANQSYNSLKSAVSDYTTKLKSLSLNTSDAAAFSELKKSYQKIGNLSSSVNKEFSAIMEKFPEDSYSRSNAKFALGLYDSLTKPETALEALFLSDASEETLNNYLKMLNPDKAVAQQIRSDYEAYADCCKSRSLTSCNRYLNGNYSLFRKDVEKMKVVIVDEENQKKDEELWRSTDKTSKVALLNYLNADTGRFKAYKEQANAYRKEIEEIELAKAKERAAWEKMDKSDKNQLQAYLRANPKSGYTKEINDYLRDIAWEETDKENSASLQAFISEWPRTPYTVEAEARLNLINGRQEMSKKNYQEAYNLYSKAAKVLTLSDKDNRNYTTLKSIEAQRLEDEREMRTFNRWDNDKTMDNAQLYVCSFPSGKHSKIVNDWIKTEEKRIEKEDEYMQKCAKIEKRTRIQYDTQTRYDYEKYASTKKNPSYEGYYAFLKEYERRNFGSWFQISCGGNAFIFSIGKDEDPDHVSGNGFGAVAGIKIGRNSSVANFHFGCEFNYLTMKSKIVATDGSGTTGEDFDAGLTDGTGENATTIKINVWDYSPYALLRLNCSMDKGRCIHFDLGGGYGITTHTGYGQLGMGYSPRKWIDINTSIRMGASYKKSYVAWGAQVLFYIF